MVRKTTLALGALGAVAAASGAWTRYQRAKTPTVPYTTVARLGDVELRRYPAAVAVETTAPSESEAFRRLFRYLSGENEPATDVSMTAPVEVDGQAVAMTAPVETAIGGRLPRPSAFVDAGDAASTSGDETAEGATAGDGDAAGVRMAFYLPSEYDVDAAPRPTDDRVELVAVPERTLAVASFRWRPTDGRVREHTERLLDALDRADVPVDGDPFYLGYDAPWTLPPLRRNEVAVPVRSGP